MEEVKDDLVFVLSRDEGKVVVIDSRIIARELGKKHKHILRKINLVINELEPSPKLDTRKDYDLIDDGTFFATNFTYIDEKGKSISSVIMNFELAINVIAGPANSKVRKNRMAIIAAFSDMRKQLEAIRIEHAEDELRLAELRLAALRSMQTKLK